MSLKIINNGFTIGGVLNPNITQIYVRSNVNMGHQQLVTVKNQEGNDVQMISIKTQVKVTLEGGLFDAPIQVDYISPVYWLNYSPDVEDMNSQYLEIEEDLKEKLITNNPEWAGNIEIVSVGS